MPAQFGECWGGFTTKRLPRRRRNWFEWSAGGLRRCSGLPGGLSHVRSVGRCGAVRRRWGDPLIGIPWPVDNPALSERDLSVPGFDSATSPFQYEQ